MRVTVKKALFTVTNPAPGYGRRDRGNVQVMTNTAQGDEPVEIKASGPTNVAEQVTVARTFRNNPEAVDAKEAESLKAQNAPNPTTDADLAREAYGEDWNKRRGPKVIAETGDGDPIMNHGGVAVDTAGHALGHASDPEAAADLRDRLVNSPRATDSDRYPVTAEARARDNADGNRYTEPTDGKLQVRSDEDDESV